MPSLHSLLSRLQLRTLRRRKVQPKAKALLRTDNAILLINHPREGHWRLPGGLVQDDESAYEAVARAVQRLTGLLPQNATPIARIDESQFRPDVMYGDFFQMYATLFLITQWRGQPTAGGEDAWRADFFAADALPHPLHEEVPLALKALQAFDETGQIKVF